jgi:aryl-alcohol dehydrogenase-like predicted oxidoreductase
VIRHHEIKREMCRTAFDLGITHFDLANNYGPPPGSAESAFGEILKTDFHGLRDEMIISSKAGYGMWPGPYGEWGSRKYLIASCDQSLKRMGLDYVDIFYSHRFDPDTPLEETMQALRLHRPFRARALCGDFELQFQADKGSGRDPQGSRHALPDPSAKLFDDQPLGRG